MKLALGEEEEKKVVSGRFCYPEVTPFSACYGVVQRRNKSVKIYHALPNLKRNVAKTSKAALACLSRDLMVF